MKNIVIGSRVQLVKDVYNIPYLYHRRGYSDFKVGQMGTVVKFNGSGDKIGIEFDYEVWNGYDVQVSSFDNGCHGVGKMHHCAYLPIDYVNVVGVNLRVKKLNFYERFKKVILCKDVDSFMDEMNNSSDYKMSAQTFMYDKWRNFINSDFEKKALIITYDDLLSDVELAYNLYQNSIMIYKFTNDSYWEEHFMNNLVIVESTWLKASYSKLIFIPQPTPKKPKVSHEIIVVMGVQQKIIKSRNNPNDIHLFGDTPNKTEVYENFIKNGGVLLFSSSVYKQGGFRIPNDCDIYYATIILGGGIIYSKDHDYILKKYKNYVKDVMLEKSSPISIMQSIGRMIREDIEKIPIIKDFGGISMASSLVPIVPIDSPNCTIHYLDFVYDPIGNDYDNLIYTDYVNEL